MNSFDDELRSALGAVQDADFDYDALVAGTKTRARRIRRRRALTQGVAAAVLVPTLVASGWMIGTNLSGTGQGVPDVAGTTQTSEPTEDRAPTTEDAPATEEPPAEDAPVTEEPPTGDSALPPFQQVSPPEPLDPGWPSGETPGNREQIPDARPTGIPFLDALGSPRHLMEGPGSVPLDGFTGSVEQGTRDARAVAGDAHSAFSWSYYDGTNEFRQVTVVVTITAWDDSGAALHALRTDEPTEMTHVWLEWVPRPDDPTDIMPVRIVPDLLPWEGHADSEDHLLVLEPDVVEDMDRAGALIRQGDYLVGVTVQDFTEEGALEAAELIAEQTAANLAHLDPEHGQDQR